MPHGTDLTAGSGSEPVAFEGSSVDYGLIRLYGILLATIRFAKAPWLLFTMALAIVMLTSACSANGTKKPSGTLEKTLGDLVGSSALPRPEDLAASLHFAISKPMLMSSYGYEPEALNLIYEVGANPLGVTKMQSHVETDKSGEHEASAELSLLLDKTYCLKPASFPAKVGLKLSRIPMQGYDGGPSYELKSYQSPFADAVTLRLESTSDEDCAKSVTLSRFYGPKEEGPAMTAAIPRDIANKFPVHPPFTVDQFWQTLMVMIQRHHGYIAPAELAQSLNVTFTPIQMGYKSTAGRELRARDGWYFKLFYDVTGPGYQSVQPGVVPNGQGSSLTIEIPSFSFIDESGALTCLTTRTVEAGLLDAGWQSDSHQNVPSGRWQRETFKLTGKDSNISVFAARLTGHDCVEELRIAGALE